MKLAHHPFILRGLGEDRQEKRGGRRQEATI
jgi:hypothetical protein